METEKQQAAHRCQEAQGQFSCDFCPSNFIWRSEFVEHLNAVHNFKGEKNPLVLNW